ncbi:MAG TPA: PAS domain S-box protein [Holophagaceae bacterium]|nr:PAS domain S-box protein [Holophagaceae bacterium]
MAGSIETRNLVGSALAVLLVGVAFAAVFRFMDQTQVSAESRGKVNVALQTLEQGLSQLKDMETGQRGFLLTGQADYLAPYESERGQAAATISTFMKLEGARQLPPQDLTELLSLTRAKIDELAQTVRLAQIGKRDEALAIVAKGEGRQTMDRLRALHDKLAASLEARRDLDDQRMRDSRQHAQGALLLLGSLGLLCIAFSAWTLHRDIQSRATSERALAASEARLHLMVENIRDYAILMLDPEGRISTWNAGAARIKGYEAEEIIGRHFSCFYPPEDAAEGRPEQILRKALEEGRAEEEGWRVRKDGTRFWADVVITTLREDGGRLLGFVKVTRDLTERQRAEENIRASEHRFRTLAEAAPVGIFEMDATGHRPYINRALCAMAELGYEEATTVGFRHRIHPEDLDRVLRHWERVRAVGAESLLEYRLVLPDGRVRWVESRAAPVPGTDGGSGMHIGIVVDRTEQRQTQEELKASERRFRTLAESAPVGIYEYDFERGMVYANEAHCQLAGVPREEATRERLRAAVHPEDRPWVIERVEADMRGGLAFDQIYRLLHSDGKVIWVHSRGTPIEDRPGHGTSYLIISQDITAIRTAEAEILAKAEALESANKELEAFAYSVSHDLRAPLRHIDGFVGLLRRSLGGGVSEQARHHLDVISASARQMGALIDDLLTFSRMGRAEIHKTTFDLGVLTRRVIEELSPDAAGRDVEWRIDGLPSVHADPALLRLVLLNLVGNALKFTRGKTPARITISTGTPDGAAAITVRDNGAGFDMRYADKLFGVFQRLHRQDEFEGTGIGLANVARIIQKHGGTVSAEGVVDKGAAFTFTLPALETP